jgi:hypothetical protein
VDPAEGFQCPLPQGHIAQISTHGLWYTTCSQAD